MTHTYTHHSFLMISTINDMEACDFNGLCRKILGKRDSVILQKKKKKKTHTYTHIDRGTRVYALTSLPLIHITFSEKFSRKRKVGLSLSSIP